MNNRPVVVGWIWLTVASARLFADCDFRPVLSQSFRTTALDLAVDGSDLWLATSYGVNLYDRTVNPPLLVARTALPGTTLRVQPAGSYVYVASGSRLYVLDRAGLGVAGSRDFGAVIHDLLFLAPHLYLATATGVLQVDLLVPEQPQLANRMQTSSGAALSLAHSGFFLYAADGDGTVEVYTLQVPTFPQKIGTISSLARSIAVHSSGSRLFVSDGVQTEVFTGNGAQMSRSTSLPTSGSMTLAALNADVVFSAGFDRRLRAHDLATSTVLFDFDLPVTAGNVNRVFAMTATGQQLYVGAGDLGLLTFDVSQFRSPFPLRAYPIGTSTSVVESGSSVFATLESGGMRRFIRDAQGSLVDRGLWDGDRQSIVHDASATSLLSSAGSTLFRWDLTSSPPVAVSTVTLASLIRGAVLMDQVAYALLENHSLWRVEMSQPSASGSPVSISGARPWFLARDGTAIALADLEENGTTTIRYFGGGDLTTAPQVISIEGAATSGIAVSRTGFATGATFRGVILADFESGTTSVLPGTNTSLTRDLYISGDDLYVLNPSKIQMWSLGSRELRADYDLPWEAVSLHHSDDEVSIAGADGLITVAPRSDRRQPELTNDPAANRYFRKVVLGGDFLFLLEGRNIDVFAAGSARPAFTRTIVAGATVVDIAASQQRLFALTSFGRVFSYMPDGSMAGEYQMQEGDNAQPLAIRVLAGAVYLSVSRGCPLACEKKTIVLDPRGSEIVQTFSFSGALIDGVVHQGSAYTIFDSPREIRILSLTDPYRPSVRSAAPTEGDPVSVAYSASFQAAYTLGQKLYAYSTPSLSPAGSQLEPYVTDPESLLGYADQVVRPVSPDCAMIAGRAFHPQLHLLAALAGWLPAATSRVPSPVRSIAARDDVIFLLTDHSLEVWSTKPLPRARPTRR